MKTNFIILILLLTLVITLPNRNLIEESDKNLNSNENNLETEEEEEEEEKEEKENTNNQNENPPKKNPENENEEEEDLEEIEKRRQQQLDENAIARSKIKKENLPSVQVLLPIRRIDTSNSQIDVSPCGGVEKKLANTLTTKNSTINFIWEIQVPEYSGNCTVKISQGLNEDKSFKILKPLNSDQNDDGSFICGREKGFEQKEFQLPEDYECDGCILQFTWNTPYGSIYSCSDIIINGQNLENCMGKCLNGGSCFNGKCLCLKGFSGDFCEDSESSSSKAWLWILLTILGICALGAGVYYTYPWFKNMLKNCMNRKQSEGWTYFNNDKNVSPTFDQGKNMSSLPEERNASQ